MSPLIFLMLSCGKGGEPTPGPFDDLEASEQYMLSGLTCPVEVIRTESDVPRIYAHNREDLGRVQGFVVARHRFFMMDLARRLALGTTAELLGSDALEVDLESRQLAMTFVARQLRENLTEEQEVLFAAFAEGINDYIAAVEAGELPPPSEMEIAAPLLGYEEPYEIMDPFTVDDIAAVGATLIYELGFETGDIGRANTEATLDSLFQDAALGELRRDGARVDLWEHVNQVYPVSSSDGWGVNGSGVSAARTARTAPAATGAAARPVPARSLSRLADRLGRFQKRLGHDWEQGFGSNAWAVAGGATESGGALLAADGHLSLTVPSLFYQIGLDTALLGGGDIHQAGLIIPGLPILAVGTNGKVAWNQTQLFGDITDWYREEIQLGDDGLPSASLFQGEWKALERVDEELVVADVPLLDSEGRTETWARWTTFDGRWITEIEGTQVGSVEEAGGQPVVNLQGDLVIPGDVDSDGVITALAFDYTGLEPANILAALEGFGVSDDLDEFQEATRRLVAYSQNIVAIDGSGSVLYTGYQAVPCREYLERNSDGSWAEGSDPSQLLDGTVYGGFTVPLEDGLVQEGDSDPYRCVVPWDDYPKALDPARNYVLTSNNDPGNISTDDSLYDDPWYIGGPWLEGYRAHAVEQELTALTTAGGVTIEDMATLQADVRSGLGLQFGPAMVAAVDTARAADGAAEGAEGRLAALYAADPEGLDEAAARVSAWLDAGGIAASGVETFYSSPTDDDVQDSVATAIFNAWFNRFKAATLDDEGLPDVWEPTGGTGVTRALTRLVDGRGPDNPEDLASWNPDTEESAFFDVLGTDEVETSEELMVGTLLDALEYLRSEPTDPGYGGYGTDDMGEWLWGLRHMVKFQSLLGDFIGGGDYDFLVDQFSITTSKLPLADDIGSGDPREDLPWFPRQGDNFSVDAANPGFSTSDPTYGSGPVFRMVIELNGDKVSGQNVIPGGQSALTSSDYFADQAELWLANETMPLRFHLEEVLEGAQLREIYVPPDLGAGCP